MKRPIIFTPFTVAKAKKKHHQILRKDSNMSKQYQATPFETLKLQSYSKKSKLSFKQALFEFYGVKAQQISRKSNGNSKKNTYIVTY